jgi:hypothetical protein
LSEGQLRALVEARFPASEVEKAMLVADCESNFDANAYNPAGPYVGLFQHALSAWDQRAVSAGVAGSPWWDPAANVAVTAWLLEAGGWGHWPWCSSWADGQLGG